MTSQRTSFEIMMDLLRALADQGRKRGEPGEVMELTQRSLMRSANLNHQQLQKYVRALEEKEFIVRHDRGRGLHIELTGKGQRALRDPSRPEVIESLLREEDRRILEYLDEGRNTAANIARETGYDRQFVYHRLMWLAEKGYVENIGNGVFERVMVSTPL